MRQKTLNSVGGLNLLLCTAFFLAGIATVLIGQVLPILARKLEINDRQAGYFFIAQFAGSLIGTLASTWFARRQRFLLANVFGCLLIAAGVLFLNAEAYFLCLFGFVLNGIGIGLTLPAINLLTLEINAARPAAALNILNFFWGVGAVSSQPFVDFFSRGTSIFIPTAVLAAAFAMIAVIVNLIPRRIERESNADEERSETVGALPIWTNPLAWMIAFFNFIHVGFESGMGGWLNTYTGRLENAPTAGLFSPILLYFLFFVVGRGIAPIFLRFFSENKLLLLNSLTVFIGTAVIIYAPDIRLLSLGAAIAGFGTSSIFPTNLSRFSQIFGSAATKRATPLFICGTLGAAFTTWLVGFASFYFGNLRSGMFVLLFSGLTLIILQIFLTRRTNRRELVSAT
ncbi:MAG: MFS transporter [Pyrinomonadaceae bacterium]|nr:MFS transporter [Pyrinomonadaceae bacterium]